MTLKLPSRLIFSIFSIWVLISCQTKPVTVKPYEPELAVTFDSLLQNNILKIWYPLMIDSVDGGYFSNASFDWKLMDHQPKMLVTQARHIWTCSQAALFYNDSLYTTYARHGVNFLIGKMWDPEYGGFFNIRSKEGAFTEELFADKKMAYGNAFAIYGLASYFNLTHDSIALDYAKKTFLWLEKYSHDPGRGGFVDQMNRDGSWFSRKNINETGQPANFRKDYNSSIHLLEAFAELYKVWPDPLVKTRLEEMLLLVRDTFTNPTGYLNLKFNLEWELISNRDSTREVISSRSGMDHISFGHDVETAFLLLEASDALEIENDAKTLKVAKKLVDHALQNGFCEQCGGLYNSGYYFKGEKHLTIFDKNAEWWAQAEGLNAFLMMAKIFPDDKNYSEAFYKIWNYISTNLIDPVHGEWYLNGKNYNPDVVNAPKSTIWKANYHNGRALMNCIRMLNGQSELVQNFTKVSIQNVNKNNKDIKK